MDMRVVAAAGCVMLGIGDLIYLNAQVLPAIVSGSDAGSQVSEQARAPSGQPADPVARHTERKLKGDRVAGSLPPPAAPPVDSEVQIVYFDTGSIELDDRARAAIDRVARRLLDDPQLVVRIDGHADQRGEAEHNVELAQRRAETVAGRLSERAVAAERITVQSFGESRPRTSGMAPHELQENRRVELYIQPGLERAKRGEW